jgi:hypothetical protein
VEIWARWDRDASYESMGGDGKQERGSGKENGCQIRDISSLDMVREEEVHGKPT